MIGAPVFLAEIILGGRQWLGCSLGICVIGLAVLIWAYLRAGHVVWVRLVAALLKAVAIVLLAALLVEPLFTGTRPRPGSNIFLVVADNSRSLQLSDRWHAKSRGATMKDALSEQASWLTRLAQDFDVRRYAFDGAPRPLKDFSEITLDGESSAVGGTLMALGDRYRVIFPEHRRTKPPASDALLRSLITRAQAEGAIDAALSPHWVIATLRALLRTAVGEIEARRLSREAAPARVVRTLVRGVGCE